MTSKEIADEIKKINAKLDRLKPTDDRILDAYRSMEKKRRQMVSYGCSEETLAVMDYSLNLIRSIVNSIENERERIKKLEAAQKAKEQAELFEKNARERNSLTTWNLSCQHFNFIRGEVICAVKMDTCFCSKKCPYATNVPGGYTVDASGMTILKPERRS